MTTIDKKDLIEDFVSGSSIFDDLLELDSEVLQFRPEAEDAWTIQEHLVHCLEVDIANFTRYRKGIVEPGSSIFSVDATWMQLLNYDCFSVADVVATIKLMRKLMYVHIGTIVDDNWQDFSLDWAGKHDVQYHHLIPAMINHLKGHRSFIDRNLNEYKK